MQPFAPTPRAPHRARTLDLAGGSKTLTRAEGDGHHEQHGNFAGPGRVAAAINPWIVAAAVVMPTFMEVLDTTIANVALRYIAGGLSAAVIDSEWVITSYLAANAIDSADLRLALGPPGPAQLFPDVDRRLHHRLGPVRHGHQPGQIILFRVHPGPGRRRVAAVQPGRVARQFPAGEAGRRP